MKKTGDSQQEGGMVNEWCVYASQKESVRWRWYK